MNGCFLGTFCVINGTLGQKREGGRQRRRGKSEAEISLCSSLLGPVSQKRGEKEERERQGNAPDRAQVPQIRTVLVAGADSEKDMGLRVSQAQVSGLSWWPGG